MIINSDSPGHHADSSSSFKSDRGSPVPLFQNGMSSKLQWFNAGAAHSCSHTKWGDPMVDPWVCPSLSLVGDHSGPATRSPPSLDDLPLVFAGRATAGESVMEIEMAGRTSINQSINNQSTYCLVKSLAPLLNNRFGFRFSSSLRHIVRELALVASVALSIAREMSAKRLLALARWRWHSFGSFATGTHFLRCRVIVAV